MKSDLIGMEAFEIVFVIQSLLLALYTMYKASYR
jgi:hypothetical protein